MDANTRKFDRKRHRFYLMVFLMSWTLLPTIEAQENWPRFQGHNGTGLAVDAQLPGSVTDNDFVWKIKLAGVGVSSPVVQGDHIYVTSCNPKTGLLVLQCFQRTTGDEVWKSEFKQEVYRVHGRNSFASSTPATDDDHVYVTYADPGHTILKALDHQGNEVWSRDFGTWVSSHGYSASPIVYKDKVILFDSQQASELRRNQQPGESRMVAVSCANGKDVWTSALTPNRACYAVPAIFQDGSGNDQIVSCNTMNGFFSLDPKTGKQNWSAEPFRLRTVASTLVADGLIIGSNGSGGGGNYLVAIRPGEDGGNPKKAYQVSEANYVPTPVAVNGLLYLFADRGIVQCVDLQSGEPLYRKRVSTGFAGSAVATKDFIYIVDSAGTLHVIAAKPTFEEISSLDLGERSQASPAIAGNRLYLRTDSTLICVGKK